MRTVYSQPCVSRFVTLLRGCFEPCRTPLFTFYAASLSNTVTEDELMGQRINSSDSAGHLQSVQIKAECTELKLKRRHLRLSCSHIKVMCFPSSPPPSHSNPPHPQSPHILSFVLCTHTHTTPTGPLVFMSLAAFSYYVTFKKK